MLERACMIHLCSLTLISCLLCVTALVLVSVLPFCAHPCPTFAPSLVLYIQSRKVTKEFFVVVIFFRWATWAIDELAILTLRRVFEESRLMKCTDMGSEAPYHTSRPRRPPGISTHNGDERSEEKEARPSARNNAQSIFFFFFFLPRGVRFDCLFART